MFPKLAAEQTMAQAFEFPENANPRSVALCAQTEMRGR
jgi:hypothetical protein